jgi:hypothetical protein
MHADLWLALAIILVALGVGYFVWLSEARKAVIEQFATNAPPANHLTWHLCRKNELPQSKSLVEASQAASSRSRHRNIDFTVTISGTTTPGGHQSDFLSDPSSWGALGDSAVAGVSLAEIALQIDQQVLSALQFSTVQELHGLPSIDTYVHDHFFSVPAESADGWFERLSGYVAEQKAATFFEQAGRHVEFARIPNQPVWDMLVDGHPVQIKESLSGVKEFIVQHPGVDVYTDPQIVAAVKDPAVHALDVLDKDAVYSATGNTLHAVHGAVNPDFHFPVITLTLATYREAKLLWNERTSIERALAHITLDVAGVGGGAWAGAKAGSAVASVFGLPGIAAGLLLGAIAGAIGGKFLSTGIRLAPFRAARTKYMDTIAAAQSAVDREVRHSKEQIVQLQGLYQGRYSTERSLIEEETSAEILEITKNFDAQLLQFCERFPRFLEELVDLLEQEKRDMLARVPGSGFWRFVVPSRNDLLRKLIVSWFENAQLVVQSELQRFKAMQPRNLDSLHSEIQRFLGEYKFELESLSVQIAETQGQFNQTQEHIQAVKELALKKASDIRDKLARDMGKEASKLHEEIVAEIHSWNGRIREKKSLLQSEAAAVGISF